MIKIKKSHEGELRSELGAKKGQKIPAERLEEAKESRNPAERKRATFAINARGWAKGRSK